MEKPKKMDEGYIKFNCNLVDGPAPDRKLLGKLNEWRGKMFGLGLIGMYPNGIGFGNISERQGKNFIISGSATGQIETLKPEHYVLVTRYSLDENALDCVGKIRASSESLTHAAIYEASPETRAVIHIHNRKAWDALLNKVPTTANVPYGTPEMAREMLRLFRESDVGEQKLIVMAGHEEGIVSFGRTLDEAGEVILRRVKPLI